MLYLTSGRTTDEDLHSIKDILSTANRGETPIHLTIQTAQGEVKLVRAGDQFRVKRSPELESALASWM